MQRSSVVIAAVVLAAIFAGLLWYQLSTPGSTTPTPTPTPETAQIVESVIPTPTPFEAMTPLPTPTNEPRITPQAARSVNPTAQTGPADMALVAFALISAGAGSLAYAIKRN